MQTKFKVGDTVKDDTMSRGVVTDICGPRIRVSWENGNATWERESDIGSY